MEWFSITHQFWIEKPIKSTSRLAFQKRPQKQICIEFITSSAICHWIIQAFKSMVSRAFSCFSIFALRRDIAHFLLSGAENPPFYRSLHAAECVVCLFFLHLHKQNKCWKYPESVACVRPNTMIMCNKWWKRNRGIFTSMSFDAHS